MARNNVHVQHTPQQLTITITGSGIGNVQTKMLTDCLNTLMECADTNDCFGKGFGIKCLETISKHDAQCGCVSKAFGIA
jgi:hypothetical protein